MRGFLRVVVRLVAMAFVMAGVLVAATALGLPTAAVLGLSITVAGLAGMVGLSRRLDDLPAASPPAAAAASAAPVAPAASTPLGPDAAADPLIASMAPDQAVDPEALMPRWRRPSLLAARKADPLRVSHGGRTSLRFATREVPTSRRVVRYAVVALLDRPDEVLGRQLADLQAGDEVDVLDATGAFWQVACPDGAQGWVHRMTLGAVPAEPAAHTWRHADAGADQDDLLSAVLSARGLQ
jgi:hypothetical protein